MHLSPPSSAHCQTKALDSKQARPEHHPLALNSYSLLLLAMPSNDLISLVLQTSHLFNFHCLAQLSLEPTAPSILNQSCKHEKEKQRKATWQCRADRPVHLLPPVC